MLSRLRLGRLCVCCLGLCVTASTVSADTSMSAEQLDRFLAALDANDKAMLSVAVRKEGNLVYQASVGFADVEREALADASTVYRAGSISKSFTAALILKLVAAQRLSLDMPLAIFFKQFPNADKITIRHLLQHRSGLFNYTARDDVLDFMHEAQTQAQMLKRMASPEPEFEPGAQHAYSNTNYVLLGYIIEAVTQQSYADVLQAYIARPLGLTRTSYGGAIDTEDNQAYSYRWQGEWVKSVHADMSVSHAAGAVVSTPADVTRFYAGLFADELQLGPLLEEMKTLVDGYGLGVFRMPFHALYLYGHNGRIDGFESSGSCELQQQVCIAVLANGLNYGFNDILIAVASAAFGVPFEIPDLSIRAIELAPEDAERYVGNYVSAAFPLDIRVFMRDGQLHAQATGQAAFALSAYPGHEFRFDPAGVVMRFMIQDQEPATLTLQQAGASYSFTRE